MMKELYKTIVDNFSKKSINGIINRKEMFNIMGVVYHFPKNVKKKVLIEMEQINMIEKINKGKYKIT